jgi:membrane protein implicated in regulation of membrane protease activity
VDSYLSVEPYLYWILAAIALVIIELLTGTFYLLVLGIAACAGGTLAWLRMPLAAQAALATVVGALGVVLVHRYRVRSPGATSGSNAIDIGHRVTLESWIDESEGLARVSYRGTLWDAKVVGERSAGPVFYIRGVDGSTLHIAAAQS